MIAKTSIIISSLIWLVLFVYGIFTYNESKIIYFIFSFVYLILLISALYKTITYSYLFLTIMLWLGLWLKLTLHLIFNYPYIEPIGSFYSMDTKMDDVLIIATLGGVGTVLARLLYSFYIFKVTTKIRNNYQKNIFLYTLYKKYKVYIFSCLLFITISLSILNIIFNIQLSGMVPGTILIYPFNAIIYWLLNFGIVLFIAILISWNIRFEKELLFRYLFFYMIISAITSIALLSRGQYIFMTGSVLVFLLINCQKYNNINLRNIILFSFLILLVYVFIIQAVTYLREYYFSGLIVSEAAFTETLFSELALTETYRLILRLAVDRWVGLEGLMAVVSYPDKSLDLFFNALSSKAKIGEIDVYQYISNAHYKDMNNMKFTFATIPGIIAFLFYTGSSVFVLIGMFIMSMIMMLIEYSIYKYFKYSLISAIVGIHLANIICQFGLMPINILKSLFFLFSFLTFIRLLENNFFLKISKGTK